MDIDEKLKEARKCINQSLIGLEEKKKDDVFEIRIPNLRPDEAPFVRDKIRKFINELLNKLQVRRNQRN